MLDFQAPDFKVQLKPTPKVEKKKDEVEREQVQLKKIPDKPVSSSIKCYIGGNRLNFDVCTDR